MTGTFNRFSTQAARLLCLLFAALLAPKSVDAALYIDLRFADGSTTHNVSTADIGGFVPVDVWARVIGADADPTNEVFKAAYLGVRSTSSNVALLDADISSTPIASAPFNNTFYTPRFRDQNVQPQFGERSSPADTTTDLGGPALNSVYGFLKPRSGSAYADATPIAGESQPASSGGVGWEWRLARFNVAINLVAAVGSNALTFAPYNSTANPITQLSAYGQDLGNGNAYVAGPFSPGSTISFNTVAPPASSGVDIDPELTTANLGNLLRNAVVDSPIRLTNVGGAAATYSTTASGAATVLAGSAGSLAPNANSVLHVGLSTSNYGNAAGDVRIITPGDPDVPTADTVHVFANVGEATSGGLVFGSNLEAAIAPGGTLVGLSSRTHASGATLGTEATIVGYSTLDNTSAFQAQMSWRDRNDTPVNGGPQGRFQTISDVVRLDTGMDRSTRNVAIAVSYNPDQLPGGAANELTLATTYQLQMGAYNSGFYLNLTEGAPFVEPFADYLANTRSLSGAKSAGELVLNDWGIDVASHTVWQVDIGFTVASVLLVTSPDIPIVFSQTRFDALRGATVHPHAQLFNHKNVASNYSLSVSNEVSTVHTLTLVSNATGTLAADGSVEALFNLATDQDKSSFAGVTANSGGVSSEIYYNIGLATIGGRPLTAELQPGESLAGLTGRDYSGSTDNTIPHTRVTFVGGVFESSAAGELALALQNTAAAHGALGAASDVAVITGLSDGNVYALQISATASPIASGQSVQDFIASGQRFFLGDLATFSPAGITDGNYGSPVLLSFTDYLAGQTSSFGQKPSSVMHLHDWGIDPTTHDVWAVVNHPGSYLAIRSISVVPEPSTWALAALAVPALAVAGVRGRKKRTSIPHASIADFVA